MQPEDGKQEQTQLMDPSGVGPRRNSPGHSLGIDFWDMIIIILLLLSVPGKKMLLKQVWRLFPRNTFPVYLCFHSNSSQKALTTKTAAPSPRCTEPTRGSRMHSTQHLAPQVFALISLPPYFWERQDWQRVHPKIALPLGWFQRKMSHIS